MAANRANADNFPEHLFLEPQPSGQDISDSHFLSFALFQLRI
jgi:hypothetical protein